MLDLEFTGGASDRAADLEVALLRIGEAMTASPLGVARMDLDGTFVSVNAALVVPRMRWWRSVVSASRSVVRSEMPSARGPM
jgi:hypothetical protein